MKWQSFELRASVVSGPAGKAVIVFYDFRIVTRDPAAAFIVLLVSPLSPYPLMREQASSRAGALRVARSFAREWAEGSVRRSVKSAVRRARRGAQ